VSLTVGVIGPKATTVERLASLLEAAGQRVKVRAVVQTSKPALSAHLKLWIQDPAIELVIGVVGATMRAALLPLITKRLVGFSDLREIDGGQCDSTIVLLVPADDVSREMLDAILPRIVRELRPRRGPTEPPPVRTRQKTTPPPIPPLKSDDYVETHRRPPEAEFEKTVVAAISPVRLEPLPVVVEPIAKQQRRPHASWVAIGCSALAGALFGTMIGWQERTQVATPARIEHKRVEADVEAAPPASDDDGDTDDASPHPTIEMPAVKLPRNRSKPRVLSTKPTSPNARVPSATQIWETPPEACNAISCGLDNFARPCCEAFRR
jgi:hypothetical protein